MLLIRFGWILGCYSIGVELVLSIDLSLPELELLSVLILTSFPPLFLGFLFLEFAFLFMNLIS